jgi:hypothetical protein
LQRKSPEVEALLPALVDQDQLMTLNLIRSSLHERFSTDPVFAISNQLKARAMTVVFKGPHDFVAGYGIRVEINPKSEVGISSSRLKI